MPFIAEPPFVGGIAGLNPRSKVACHVTLRDGEANSHGSNLGRATRIEKRTAKAESLERARDYRKTEHRSSVMLRPRQCLVGWLPADGANQSHIVFENLKARQFTRCCCRLIGLVGLTDFQDAAN